MIRPLRMAHPLVCLVLLVTVTSVDANGQTVNDKRMHEVVWDRGFPPDGCYWECTREEGCSQTSNKPMAFPADVDPATIARVTLPGQLINGVRNPQAPAFTVGKGEPRPPGGLYAHGTRITQSVTIPQNEDGWRKACAVASATGTTQADETTAANSATGACSVSGTVMGRGSALWSGETMIVKGGVRISGDLFGFVAASTEPKPTADLTFKGCSKSQIASIQQCTGVVRVLAGKYETSFSECTGEQVQNVRGIIERYAPETWEALHTASSAILFVNPWRPK